ncbi:hypothetical protein KDA23_05665 [Candidatus Saccharibacteria bacterium]|nr:hypothetical protein [Candidatus Saccharibacteria bacterium]
MEPDRDKLQYYSGDPIDKIVASKVQKSISNDGDTTSASGTWQSAKIVTKTYTNPYGKQCFVRGRWSIDGGTSWNTFESHQRFSFTILIINPVNPSQLGQGLKAAVSIGVSADLVKIVTANGDHGNVTVDIGAGTQTYTPTSHTFLVEYELFEKG